MFQQRMQALLMQDKKQIKALWSKFDLENDGYLELDEFQKALEYLGAPLDTKLAKEFMKKFSSRNGHITYEDFFVNLIGLPRDFFGQRMKRSKGFQAPRDDNLPKQLSKLLPRNTPLEAIDKLFRTKLRKLLFNVDVCMFTVLKRPTPASKFMDRDGVFNVFNGLGIMCTQLELDQLMAYFDTRSGGRLGYKELAHELLKLPRPGAKHLSAPSRAPLSGRVKTLVECLRLNAERSAANPLSLIALFKKFDSDGSGTIAYDEMADMVREFGCNVDGADSASLLLQKYAPESGAMSYVAFLTRVLGLRPDALRDPGFPDRMSTPELQQEVAGNFKRELFTNQEAIVRAFKSFDRDGSGELSLREFIEGIQALQLPISSKQAKKMFQQYDNDNSGKVTIFELGEQLLQVPSTVVPVVSAGGGTQRHKDLFLTTATLRGGESSARSTRSSGSSRYTYDSEDAYMAATLTPSQLQKSLTKIHQANQAAQSHRSVISSSCSSVHSGSYSLDTASSLDDMIRSSRSFSTEPPKTAPSRNLDQRATSGLYPLTSRGTTGAKTATQLKAEKMVTSRRHTFDNNGPGKHSLGAFVRTPGCGAARAKGKKGTLAPVHRTHHADGVGTVDLKSIGAFGGAGKKNNKGWLGGADRTCNQYIAQPVLSFASSGL